MHPAFRRMSESILAVMGEDALLRGTVPCDVNIQHGVQVTGHDENVIVERSVATIASIHNPKVGDTLSHPDGTYKLDAPFRDNGVNRRFILIKHVP